MDARKVLYRLDHILEAIAAIESYIAGKDFKAYRTDRILHDAVERNLERLSEAARYIPDELKAEHPARTPRLTLPRGNTTLAGTGDTSRAFNAMGGGATPLARSGAERG